MLQPKQHLSANDNAPLRQLPIRAKLSRFNPTFANSTPHPTAVQQRKIGVGWIIPSLAVLCGAFAFLQSLPLVNLFWPSLIIGTLLLLTAVQSEPESRLRNFSGLLMVAFFTTGLAALLSQNGFTLIGVELALLVSTLSLIVGWMFTSKPSVLLSSFSGLIYLASFYPELGLTTGLTDQVSLLGAGILPWVILGQIVLAQKVRSSVVLFTAIIAGYILLGTLAKDMPLTALAALGFAIAAAHYWLSKAWAEAGKFGANIHRICAWVIALGAALYIQSIWLNVDSGQAKPFWPPNTLWWTMLGAAMFTLFIASLMRFKTSYITLSGIFIICLAVAVLPAATAKPDLIYVVFDAIPGLNARPGLGLVMGAIIIAAGFIWLVGGLKRGELLDMAIGATAIGIEALVLFQPAKFNADLGVTFVVSLICALCIGGLIAGATPDHTQSLRNYA